MRIKHTLFAKSQTRDLTILALPAVLLLLLLNYLPMGGLVLAFKNYRFDQGIFGSDWVGLKNFHYLFASQDAWRITRNTVGLNLLFILTVTAGAVYFAILLSEVSKKKWVRVYQTSMFIPYFLSWPVVALIVLAFLDSNLGLLNQWLTSIGLGQVKWYSEAAAWPFLLIFVNFWKAIGYHTLIYYAGIMALDRSYYDAAAVDGATVRQIRRYIIIPMLLPLVIIMTLVQLGQVFHSDFGLFFMVTRDSGVLYPTTDVIDTYVYRSLRVVGDTGMAAAVGLYQALVGFILVLTANGIVRNINKDNSMF